MVPVLSTCPVPSMPWDPSRPICQTSKQRLRKGREQLLQGPAGGTVDLARLCKQRPDLALQAQPGDAGTAGCAVSSMALEVRGC